MAEVTLRPTADDGWIGLGSTDLGSCEAIDYNPETGELTRTRWTRTPIEGRSYPAGTPVAEVVRDLLGDVPLI